MKTRSALGLAVAAAVLAAAPLAPAGDWPAWRGPHRDGTSEEKGLVSTWSKTGENLVWKAELAKEDVTARATPVVFDGRACISARAGTGLLRQEIVACFDAGTGKKLWERRFPVYNTTVPFSRVGWASLAGDPETGYVYAQNVDGHLVALDRAGKTVWQRRLGEELGRGSGYGGRTLVPIVDEDRLILGVVGAGWGDMAGPRQRYVAFDKRTGAVRWVSTPSDGPFEDANNNASPTVGDVDGRRLMVAGGGRRLALRGRRAHGRARLEVPPQRAQRQLPAPHPGPRRLRRPQRGERGQPGPHGPRGGDRRARPRRHHEDRRDLARRRDRGRLRRPHDRRGPGPRRGQRGQPARARREDRQAAVDLQPRARSAAAPRPAPTASSTRPSRPATSSSSEGDPTGARRRSTRRPSRCRRAASPRSGARWRSPTAASTSWPRTASTASAGRTRRSR